MRDRDKLLLMLISIPLLLILEKLKLCYSDWLSLTLCYVGLVLMLGSFHFLPEVIQSSRWPSAEGKIITSKKITRSSSPTLSTSYPKVEYTYSVDGVEYKANRFRLGVQDITDTRPEWVQGTLDKYPVDKEVKVFFNPRNPAKAVLERGLNICVFGFTLLGTLFYLIGLIVGWFWWASVNNITL